MSQGEDVIGTEMLGTMKTAYVIGSSKEKLEESTGRAGSGEVGLAEDVYQMTNR